MWASIGFKKTIKTITQFPALILTPIFSYWVFGPMESKSCSNLCCRENSRLGLSFFHTWINAGLTIVGQIIFTFLFYDILKQDDIGMPLYAIAIILHVFCVILLLLIQFLSQYNCCNSSCCFRSWCSLTAPVGRIPLSRGVFFMHSTIASRQASISFGS